MVKRLLGSVFMFFYAFAFIVCTSACALCYEQSETELLSKEIVHLSEDLSFNLFNWKNARLPFQLNVPDLSLGETLVSDMTKDVPSSMNDVTRGEDTGPGAGPDTAPQIIIRMH